MYFSGSTSELPWKCESILLSAWEVGWEVAHLHLKQQALLSGAQNRPVETGWKSTLALHPGCSYITALCRIVLKDPKWIQTISPTRGSWKYTVIIPFPRFTPSKPSYITGSIRGFTIFSGTHSLNYSWAANVLTYMCQQGGKGWIKHIVRAHRMRIPSVTCVHRLDLCPKVTYMFCIKRGTDALSRPLEPNCCCGSLLSGISSQLLRSPAGPLQFPDPLQTIYPSHLFCNVCVISVYL